MVAWLSPFTLNCVTSQVSTTAGTTSLLSRHVAWLLPFVLFWDTKHMSGASVGYTSGLHSNLFSPA